MVINESDKRSCAVTILRTLRVKDTFSAKFGMEGTNSRGTAVPEDDAAGLIEAEMRDPETRLALYEGDFAKLSSARVTKADLKNYGFLSGGSLRVAEVVKSAAQEVSAEQSAQPKGNTTSAPGF